MGIVCLAFQVFALQRHYSPGLETLQYSGAFATHQDFLIFSFVERLRCLAGGSPCSCSTPAVAVASFAFARPARLHVSISKLQGCDEQATKSTMWHAAEVNRNCDTKWPSSIYCIAHEPAVSPRNILQSQGHRASAGCATLGWHEE